MTAPTHRLSTNLLEGAPDSLPEVPAWLASLDDAQFRTSWVAVVVVAVRDKYAGCLRVATDGPLSLPKQTGKVRRRRWIGNEELLSAARLRAPNPGDTFLMIDAFPDGDGNQLKARLRRSGEFDVRRSSTHRGGNGKPRLEVVRRATNPALAADLGDSK